MHMHTSDDNAKLFEMMLMMMVMNGHKKHELAIKRRHFKDGEKENASHAQSLQKKIPSSNFTSEALVLLLISKKSTC